MRSWFMSPVATNEGEGVGVGLGVNVGLGLGASVGLGLTVGLRLALGRSEGDVKAEGEAGLPPQPAIATTTINPANARPVELLTPRLPVIRTTAG